MLHPHLQTTPATADLLLKHPKRKADREMPDGSLPPNFKRPTLSHSYDIPDLAVSFPFN
jgi:hypothetical protein